ncbi:MAG: FAD-dependent oxidoreductase, partial [Pseudomonadota bacterium]|nr:FAD-dependent oxidoreductase [Pseudomonadota bacterium]
SLDALKARRAALDAYRQTHPLLLAGGFFLTYVAVTALSLPAATLLTLAAGAMFGLFEGTVLVSFASTIGATLAMLASRFVLRDTVQKRFGKRLSTINQGVQREGAFYLFTLRLVPVIPFFVVNLVMGLTKLPARTFYWVSQLGMLIATVVYVNAGTQLSQVQSASGIFSPVLIGSFVLLGIFPWIAKAIVAWVKRRKLYARWKKPKHFDRNLVVIGAGAAGLVSAYIAATVKSRVTLVEKSEMGGDCLNEGCVPSKALIHSARLAAKARHAAAAGIQVSEVKVDFAAVMTRIQRVIGDVAPHDSVQRYSELGVDVRKGHATIVSPWEVRIDDETLTTRAIVIAAGAEPLVPDLPGLADSGFLTSSTLWDLRELPRRLVVMGGGPVGCELAQAFARLGSRVTQVQKGKHLLNREDTDVSDFVEARLREDGVDVRTQYEAVAVESDARGKSLRCEHDGETVDLPFDVLLVAVGRRPRVDGYGLDELDIPAPKTIDTDRYLQTLYPNIYACGDVAGPYQLTHVGGYQAWFATVNALLGGLWRFKADYSAIPATTFVDPEVARVGLNEREAKEQETDFEVTRYELADLDRAITEDGTRGFVKVLTVPGKDRILGATIVGAHAGELLAEFTLAMTHGLGLGKILGTIHAYPTWAEANKYAAGAWRKAHTPQVALRWAARWFRWRRG